MSRAGGRAGDNPPMTDPIAPGLAGAPDERGTPHAPDAPGAPGLSVSPAEMLMHVQQTRRTVLPKRLGAPGPDDAQLALMFQAAATAPDHDQLLPWRFLVVPPAHREALGELFAQALRERDPLATGEQLAQAREKALRAPLLMLVIVHATCGDAQIDLNERLLSAGCAVQNLLLAANAQGFDSSLTSGKALKSQALRQGLGLAAQEHAVCFISVGTATARKPGPPRPPPQRFVSQWVPGGDR